MSAPKGTRPPNAGKGRKKGVPNKLTSTIKDAVFVAFTDAQIDPEHPSNLKNFSRAYPEAFMTMASKLIPRAIETATNALGRLTIIIED